MRDDSNDFFFSPITGRMYLTKDYIWVGDEQGMSVESDVIIKIQEEIKKFKPFPEDVDFITGHPSDKVHKGQALSTLTNGVLVTTDGILSTKDFEPFPKDIKFVITEKDDRLKNAQVLSTIGDGVVFNDKGTLSGKEKIDFKNLPPLTAVKVPGLELATGQIYRGTSSGVPEASNSLSILEAEALLNVNRLLANLIMGDAIVQSLYPSAQYIVNIKPDGCILKHKGKTLEAAIAGEDYVDTDTSEDGKLCIIQTGDKKKFVSRSRIVLTSGTNDYGDILSNIMSIKDLQNITVETFITCKGFIHANDELASGNIKNAGIIKIYDKTSRVTTNVQITVPNTLNESYILQLPDRFGKEGDTLVIDNNKKLIWGNSLDTIIKDLTEGIVLIEKKDNKNALATLKLTKGQIIIADDNGKPEGKDTIAITNLPKLTKDKVWVGGEGDKAEEKDFKIASSDATFVLNEKFEGLDKAQILGDLETGLMKNTTTTGKISIAKAGTDDGDDYISPKEFKKLIESKYVVTSASDLLTNAQVLDKLSSGITKISSGEFSIASGGDGQTDDYVKPSNLDTLKTKIKEEVEVKIDEKVEELRGEIEAQIAEEVAALEGEIAGLEAEIAEIIPDATAAGAAAGTDAAATAYIPFEIQLSKKESSSDHDDDIKKIKKEISDTATSLTTLITTQYNAAIANAISSVNVIGTTDEINVESVGKQFTLSLSDKAKAVDIEGVKEQITVEKKESKYTIGLDQTLINNIQSATTKINNLNIVGTPTETNVTKNGDTYTIGLVSKEPKIITLTGDIVGSGTDTIATTISPEVLTIMEKEIEDKINKELEEFKQEIEAQITEDIDKINVIGTTNEINVVSVGKEFTLSLSDGAKQKITIEGTKDEIVVTKTDEVYTIGLASKAGAVDINLTGAVIAKGSTAEPIMTTLSPEAFKNLPEPTYETDAATKNYVDEAIIKAIQELRASL